LQELDQRPEVALDVVLHDVVAALAQPCGAGLAAHQRHLALGRPAAHQDSHATHPSAPLRTGFFSPMRRISHSSLTPHCSSTRRRTSSPSASMSAAVASPVLIRKLVCFSDTCAPPTLRPRQPARSISSQALWPGGLAKVEPPVRLRGCDSTRATSI